MFRYVFHVFYSFLSRCFNLLLPVPRADRAVQVFTAEFLRPPHGGRGLVHIQRVRLHQGRSGSEREDSRALRARGFEVSCFASERRGHTHSRGAGCVWGGVIVL